MKINLIIKLIVLFFALLSVPLPGQAVADGPEAAAVELINALGCKGCHMIKNEGGSLAADLTMIGSRMTAAQIYQVLTAPESSRKNFMPAYNSVPEQDLHTISNYLYQLR